MAANRCIGRDNRMPWHLPADLAHFKRRTLGLPVIMGRRTYDSILASLGKPLPGRTSIVVSRDPGYRPAGTTGATVLHANSPAAALARARDGGAPEAFVIGGAEIYRAMLPACERLVVTEIARHFEGDAFFPAIDPAQWQEVAREPQPAGGTPAVEFAFVEYTRRLES